MKPRNGTQTLSLALEPSTNVVGKTSASGLQTDRNYWSEENSIIPGGGHLHRDMG